MKITGLKPEILPCNGWAGAELQKT